jgi:hypothetical protein
METDDLGKIAILIIKYINFNNKIYYCIWRPLLVKYFFYISTEIAVMILKILQEAIVPNWKL